jgi:phenylpropionate dioxygenase-like ring-hydroxylating dioxygenase large terminal subunit
MIRSKIPAAAYLDASILEKERSAIFQRLWIFVGLTGSLSKPQSYLTRNIGGIPIMVRRGINQELRAFENLCSHRKMIIHQDLFGVGSIICPYHGWCFDDEGNLDVIPKPELYQMRFSEKEKSGLREFAVRVAGNAIFVCLSSAPPAFEEQFSDQFIAKLTEITNHFDSSYCFAKFNVKYNWKLNFENVLDFNHVPFIHPKSFAPFLRKEPPFRGDPFPAEVTWDHDYKNAAPPQLSDLSVMREGDFDSGDRWWSAEVDGYGDKKKYTNLYIYPNVNFFSVSGDYFVFQQYMPISPGVTEYNLWCVTAKKVPMSKVEFAAVMRAIVDSEKAVIDEDTVFLENMQANLHIKAGAVQHGAYENHLLMVSDWYANHVLQSE